MIASLRKSIWFAILPFLCCTVLIALVGRSSAQTTPATTLTVKVTGIRNANGDIRVALRRDENTIVESRIVEIDPKTLSAVAVFKGLPQGSYGVSVIHDENRNGKLDFNE